MQPQYSTASCACGCGQLIVPTYNRKTHAYTRFVHGHNMTGMQRNLPRVPLAVRFWECVVQRDGCWGWAGSKDQNGYGKIGEGGRGGRDLLAHRVSWELSHGPIPNGLCVLHRCDNPECVNPLHLFLGTQTDNNADMHAKGRGSGGRFYGSAHPNAKLDEAAVREIRQARAEGARLATLAKRFGVLESTISHIARGKGWPHVA